MDVIIICANEERRAYQQRQFSDLQLPYKVMYFPGYTPNTSKSYIADYDDNCAENDETICCFRSHIGAIRQFINKSHADYCIILEDDVSLIKTGFQTQIDEILRAWKDYPDIDYVVVGYLLSDYSHDYAESCNAFEWEPRGKVTWGFQAYIVRRDSAARIVSMFDKPNTAIIRAAAWKEIKRRNGKPPYERRYPRIQSDSLIPGFFKAAYSKQLLAIEAPFASVITPDCANHKRWVRFIQSGRLNPSLYYDNDWANIVATKYRNQ